MLGVSVGTLGVIRYRALIPIVLVMVVFSQWIVPDTIIDRVNDAMSHLETYQTDSSGSNSFTRACRRHDRNRWSDGCGTSDSGQWAGKRSAAYRHRVSAAPDREWCYWAGSFSVAGSRIGSLSTSLLTTPARHRGRSVFLRADSGVHISVVVQGMVSAAWRPRSAQWNPSGYLQALLVALLCIKALSTGNLQSLLKPQTTVTDLYEETRFWNQTLRCPRRRNLQQLKLRNLFTRV